LIFPTSILLGPLNFAEGKLFNWGKFKSGNNILGDYIIVGVILKK